LGLGSKAAGRWLYNPRIDSQKRPQKRTISDNNNPAASKPRRDKQSGRIMLNSVAAV